MANMLDEIKAEQMSLAAIKEAVSPLIDPLWRERIALLLEYVEADEAWRNNNRTEDWLRFREARTRLGLASATGGGG